jgi:hypothetical protein
MLAPDRLLIPSDTAVAVSRLCDPNRSVATIAAALATEYAAAEVIILADIVPLLQDLADKGYVDGAGSWHSRIVVKFGATYGASKWGGSTRIKHGCGVNLKWAVLDRQGRAILAPGCASLATSEFF